MKITTQDPKWTSIQHSFEESPPINRLIKRAACIPNLEAELLFESTIPVIKQETKSGVFCPTPNKVKFN